MRCCRVAVPRSRQLLLATTPGGPTPARGRLRLAALVSRRDYDAWKGARAHSGGENGGSSSIERSISQCELWRLHATWRRIPRNTDLTRWTAGRQTPNDPLLHDRPASGQIAPRQNAKTDLGRAKRSLSLPFSLSQTPASHSEHTRHAQATADNRTQTLRSARPGTRVALVCALCAAI